MPGGCTVWLLGRWFLPQPGAPCNLMLVAPALACTSSRWGAPFLLSLFRLAPLLSTFSSAHCLLCRLDGLEGLGGSFKPSFKIYLCFYGSRLVGILVLRLGIEPMHSAVKAPKLNHWTAKKSPPLGRILSLFLGKDSMGLGGGICLTCSWLFILG